MGPFSYGHFSFWTNFYLLVLYTYGHVFFSLRFLHSCTVFTGSDTRRAIIFCISGFLTLLKPFFSFVSDSDASEVAQVDRRYVYEREDPQVVFSPTALRKTIFLRGDFCRYNYLSQCESTINIPKMMDVLTRV